MRPRCSDTSNHNVHLSIGDSMSIGFSPFFLHLKEKRAQDKTKGSPIAPSWRQYEHQLKNLLHGGALGAPANRGKKRSSSDSLAEEKDHDHSRKKVHVSSIPTRGANKKRTASVGSEKRRDSESNNSNLVVRETVNRKKKKKTGTVDYEDRVVTQNSATMDDSSLLGAVGLTVPAPSTASTHLNPNQLSPLHRDGGVMDIGTSCSTEVNTSTSSMEVTIVTLPNDSMTVYETQEHSTMVSGEKKSTEGTQPKKKVATSKSAGGTQPKKKVATSKSAEGTQPKKKVASSKSAEGTQPKKKVATSKSAEGTQLKKKVATSKSAEGTQPKKKVATSKSAESTQPKKKGDASKRAVKSNQTETLDKEKKRGRPKKATTPPPPPPITNNETKSRRGWPKGKPRKQKVTTTDPLTVSPAVFLPVSSGIAQPPLSVMPTESIPVETQVLAVHDVASTEDFRPGSSQDSHDDVIVTLSAQLDSSPIPMEKVDSESSPPHIAKVDSESSPPHIPKVDSESSPPHIPKVDSESTSSHVTKQVNSELELDLVKSVYVSEDSDSDTRQPRNPKPRVLPFSLAGKDSMPRTGTLPVKRKTHGNEGEESTLNPKQPLYETTVVNKMEGINKKGRKFNKSKSGTSFLPEHSLSVRVFMYYYSLCMPFPV